MTADFTSPRPVPDARRLAEITSYHAHVYYAETERGIAARVRDGIDARFRVRLGRWHDRPIGPHSRAMYQVAFDCADFARLVPWLMLNHGGLSILVHPNTRNQQRDHLADALWIGRSLDLDGDRLPIDGDPVDPVGVVNSHPLPGVPV